MLRDLDFTRYTNVYILPRYTDMRQGIPGLSAIVQYQLKLDVFDEGSLFLFCGRRRNRMKALVYEGSGFTLLYHRINANCGRFYWPMSHEDVLRMTPDQYRRLVNGFTMDPQVRVTGKRRGSTSARVEMGQPANGLQESVEKTQPQQGEPPGT